MQGLPLQDDIESIKQGGYLNKVDKYFNSFYENPATLLDYIKDDYTLFIDEIGKVKARSENILKDTRKCSKVISRTKESCAPGTNKLR